MGLELSALLRVLVAALVSGVIGLEREFHGRPAGLRTHLLVGTGAAFAVVAIEVATSLLTANATFSEALRMDPARMAAGVITGIGFLGAGTIIRTGDWVRGLTTAASIWFVAALGIAAGMGLPVLAGGGALIGLFVLSFINVLEDRIPSTAYRTIVLSVVPDRREAIHAEVRQRCKRQHIHSRLKSWEFDQESDAATMSLQVSYWRAVDLIGFAESLADIDGVSAVKLGSSV